MQAELWVYNEKHHSEQIRVGSECAYHAVGPGNEPILSRFQQGIFQTVWSSSVPLPVEELAKTTGSALSCCTLSDFNPPRFELGTLISQHIFHSICLLPLISPLQEMPTLFAFKDAFQLFSFSVHVFILKAMLMAFQNDWNGAIHSRVGIRKTNDATSFVRKKKLPGDTKSQKMSYSWAFFCLFQRNAQINTKALTKLAAVKVGWKCAWCSPSCYLLHVFK